MTHKKRSQSSEGKKLSLGEESVQVDPEVKNAQKSQVAGTPVPEQVFEDKKPHQGSVEVKETFFGRHKSGFDPGKARDGMILDHRNYCSSETDADGTPVEYRFGSFRRGYPIRNKNKGYVPARVNKDGKLDPDGNQVEVGDMILLVRKKEHGDTLRANLEERVRRSTKKRVREAGAMTEEELKGLAKKLGQEVTINKTTEEKVFDPATKKDEH